MTGPNLSSGLIFQEHASDHVHRFREEKIDLQSVDTDDDRGERGGDLRIIGVGPVLFDSVCSGDCVFVNRGVQRFLDLAGCAGKFDYGAAV